MNWYLKYVIYVSINYKFGTDLFVIVVDSCDIDEVDKIKLLKYKNY